MTPRVVGSFQRDPIILWVLADFGKQKLSLVSTIIFFSCGLQVLDAAQPEGQFYQFKEYVVGPNTNYGSLF